MTHYALPLWTPPAVTIRGRDTLFPIRRVQCVGKNYADHVREMGGDPNNVKPVFFAKSAHAVSHGVDAVTIPYPKATNDLHYEVELVVALGENKRIFGYGIGVDFTKRDLQDKAKNAGMPWDTAKNFSGAAALSALTPLEDCGEITTGAISLAVNGTLKQNGRLEDMIYPVDKILEQLEHYDDLQAGDLIYTGTPAGVEAVVAGDVMTCTIAGLPDFHVTLSAS